MSASSPEPAPSTVLSSVNISAAVWSPVEPSSTPISVLTSAGVNCFVIPVQASFLPRMTFVFRFCNFVKSTASFAICAVSIEPST